MKRSEAEASEEHEHGLHEVRAPLSLGMLHRQWPFCLLWNCWARFKRWQSAPVLWGTTFSRGPKILLEL